MPRRRQEYSVQQNNTVADIEDERRNNGRHRYGNRCVDRRAKAIHWEDSMTGEANDVSTVEQFKRNATRHGFEISEVGIDSPNDIQPRVASLVSGADVFYAPGSSLIQPAISAVVAATNEVRGPLINNNTDMVDTGIIPATAGESEDRHGRFRPYHAGCAEPRLEARRCAAKGNFQGMSWLLPPATAYRSNQFPGERT